MSFEAVLAPFLTRIMSALPSLLFGFVILVVGYVVAVIVSRLVRGLVGRTTLDRRAAELLDLPAATGQESVRSAVSRLAFWLVMLFVLIGFFSQIGLSLVADPLRAMMERVVGAGPRLLEAALILLVAWVVAALLRFLVVQVTTRLRLDERLIRFARLEEGEAAEARALPRRLGTLVFYLVLVLAIPPFLAALDQSAVVEPLVSMFQVVLTYVPNVVGALLTIAIGWVVARILREVVRNLLAAAGLDAAAARAGAGAALGEIRLSAVAGAIVYFVVWVPFIVAGLDTLQIEAVSGPAVAALNQVLGWVPKALGAAVILIVAWLVSRFLGTLVSQFCRGVGLDALPARLGLGATGSVGGRTWSDLAGVVTTTLILLFAVTEAMQVLGLIQLAAFGERLVRFAVNVLIAGVIVAFGLWVGGYVQSLLQGALERAGARQPRLVGLAGRAAVAVFAAAMALQQIGVGETIVVTAFTLLFGAICLALALAFGLGSRDVAGRLVQRSLEGDAGGPVPSRGA